MLAKSCIEIALLSHIHAAMEKSVFYMTLLHRIVGDKDTLVDVLQEHRKNDLDDDKGNTYRITVR